MKEKDARA
jgi:hypothetical protein